MWLFYNNMFLWCVKRTFLIPSHTFLNFPSAGMSSTETAQGTLCTPTKRPRESGTVGRLVPASSSAWPAPLWAPTHNPAVFLLSASGSESEVTPEKRPRTDEKEGSSEEAPRTPKQKNRRRCYRCQTKLELVQQELGSCRCGQYQHASVSLISSLTSSFIPCLISLTVAVVENVSSNKVSCWPEKLACQLWFNSYFEINVI